ncbi:MAG: hypothetical protein CL941_03470 [Desulfobacter sp.]|nr:hypothetical protein [Desulfobacter sp.]
MSHLIGALSGPFLLCSPQVIARGTGHVYGLFGFVFPPLTAALISATGWRLSWLVLGGIVFVIAVLIGGLLLTES